MTLPNTRAAGLRQAADLLIEEISLMREEIRVTGNGKKQRRIDTQIAGIDPLARRISQLASEAYYEDLKRMAQEAEEND